jgi:shikimate dehydrogenase
MILTAQTRLFGVIGDPVAHSRGPAMHNAALRAMDYPGVYLAFRTADPIGALTGMRALRIRGLSVTIPHKIAIMAMLDDVDETAARIGAVNTIAWRDGRLWGFNTDSHGAVAALAERTTLAGKRLAVLGAGGAARALVFGLRREGAVVTIYNRDSRRGEALAKELGADFRPLAAFDSGHTDIVVNTTSVGMHPLVEASPIPAETLHAGLVVMDIVYNPLHTVLLRAAQAKGCTVVDGVEMFVRQGAKQLELWTGLAAPVEIMRRAVLESLDIPPSHKVETS